MKKTGSRAEVMLDRALQTKSGLRKDDLFYCPKSKTIKSKRNSMVQKNKYHTNARVQGTLRRANERRRQQAVRRQSVRNEYNPFENVKIPTSGPIVNVPYSRVKGHTDRPPIRRMPVQRQRSVDNVDAQVRLPSFLR